MNSTDLVHFVQQQFGRIDCWCWESIIEAVARQEGIPLTEANLLYTGGTIRTGGFRFVRNDRRWKELCRKVVAYPSEARLVIDTVRTALCNPSAASVAEEWTTVAMRQVAELGEFRCIAESHLQGPQDIYRSGLAWPHRLVDLHSVVYTLWRIDDHHRPITRLPLYLGESQGSARSRIEGKPNKCHRDWWGAGIPMGVTVTHVPPGRRVNAETALIQAMLPFCNAKKSRLHAMWQFPQPV